jgi:hypothetical protein
MTGDAAGWLQQLLLRNEVEEISFDACTPMMLRLSDGRTVPGPPIVVNDEDLVAPGATS